MLRRLIAAVATLAFALAFLPAGIGWCSTDPLPCCVGKMCPMVHHRAAAKHSDCGMTGMDSAAATTTSGATFCSCSSNRDSRYVASLVFVVSVPPAATATPIVTPAQIVVLSTEPNVFSEVVPPPPRPLPS